MTDRDSAASTPALEIGVASDRGLRRELNEDAYLVADPLFAVADGMGGHEAGEVAAQECVRALGEAELSLTGAAQGSAALQQALRRADTGIRELSGSRAGTTVTGMAWLRDSGAAYWLVFNVGDSRTYRLAEGVLQQVSVDHSEVQELVDAGHLSALEARHHPRRHVVTRALGVGEDTEADYWLVPMRTGERWLICTDGLSDELPDEEISAVLEPGRSVQEAADELVRAALSAGGRDNVTVIVIDVLDSAQGSDQGSADAPASDSTNQQETDCEQA
ncbi:protein phosphatase 2C domain-containing protein [Acaricomes phytoseiuli]|uniref:PP2C family protein-serine/threonine phosphatase n=1 Tax=Acaricomes phytoseiuli TaxID=291968 RepID=UPI0022239FB8|nr:protein phosphatase 2C domain-containing protein [Acaricomes phytoseiuli]MCW1250340.1 protein phosphatase 2C domain-containing protein [Acaricomes phytoseiuli]